MTPEKTVLEKMRLTNETDIMGMLFYLVEENESIRKKLFSIIHNENLIKKKRFEIQQEKPQENLSRPDVVYYIIESKSKTKTLIGCIEAKTDSEVGKEQIDKYNNFNHITLLIPTHKVKAQELVIKDIKNKTFKIITWAQVGTILENAKINSEIEKVTASILTEHIKEKIEEIYFVFCIWKNFPKKYIADDPRFNLFLKPLASYYNVNFNTKADGTLEKWRGIYLKSKNFWIGFVNGKSLTENSNSFNLMIFTKNEDHLKIMNKINITSKYWKSDNYSKITILPTPSWKNEKWKSAFYIKPKEPNGHTNEIEVANELIEIIQQLL